MKKSFLIFTFTLALSITSVYAFAQDAQQKTISLKDGTVLKGAVTGMQDGEYTISTAKFGDIKVADSEVLSISDGSAAAPANNAMQNQMQEMQQMLLSDPAIMADLQKLAENPEIMQMMSDPAFMQDIMSYDPDRVMQNENTRKLLEVPAMKSLMEKMAGKMGVEMPEGELEP